MAKKLIKRVIRKMLKPQKKKKVIIRGSKPAKPLNPVYPQHAYCVLNYSDIAYNDIPATTGAMGYMQFKLNSLHDPQGSTNLLNSSGIGGHQPYYYDQWRTNWKRVQVYKVKLTVRLLNTGYTVNFIRDNSLDNTVPTNASLELERPGNVIKIHSGNGSGNVISKTFYLNKLVGMTLNEYLSDDAYSHACNPTADPASSNIIYGNFFSSSIDYGATAYRAQIQFNIKYYCKFYEPATVPQS